MATAELVGPVEVIRFMDGSTQVYTPPRDSMDIRYAACRDHHPACDCREAALAEHRNDSAWERRQLLDVFASTLEGQQLLEVQPEETQEQAPVRHRRAAGSQHADRSDDLRLDPGARRVRARGLVGLTT